MATYTSTQAGDWNAVATWGGGGSPNTNADIAIIGHAVKYNIGESTITWGNITLNSGGILYFPVDASSKLIMAAESVLTINSGGEIRTGTSGAAAVLDDAYTLKIHFNQPSAVKTIIDHKNGGIINIWGDTAYYGNSRYAYLSADWTSGQSFYVTGDFSSKWIAGQMFWIFKNGNSYESYTTASKIYTIASVGAYDSGNNRTQITISESAPGLTFQATSSAGYTSPVILISRNVHIADPGATLQIAAAYTKRIRMVSTQSTNKLVNFKGCFFYGFDYFSGITNFIFDDCCAACIGQFAYSGGTVKFSGDLVGLGAYGYSASTHTIEGNIVGTQGTSCNASFSYITGDIISASSGISGNCITLIGNGVGIQYGASTSTGCLWVGNCYSSSYVVSTTSNLTFIGNAINNANLTYSIVFKNLWKGDFPTGVAAGGVVMEDSTIAGANRFPFRIYSIGGNILPLVSGDSNFQTPDSGNAWIFEAIPNSSYNLYSVYTTQLSISPINPIAAYVTSGSKTLTYKIYPVGWTNLTGADVALEVSYLDSASGITRTTVYNTPATAYSDGAWRSCSVAFNPSQNGIVYINMYIRRYVASAYILIDPVFTVA